VIIIWTLANINIADWNGALNLKLPIATLMFQLLETGLSPYFAPQLCLFAPTTALRSYTSKLLQVPLMNLWYGSCSFHVPAPTLWNSIPHSGIHFCESLTTFWKHLKTFYFQTCCYFMPSKLVHQFHVRPSISRPVRQFHVRHFQHRRFMSHSVDDTLEVAVIVAIWSVFNEDFVGLFNGSPIKFFTKITQQLCSEIQLF